MYEFISHYDYIQDFNRKYAKFEYQSSPSLSYTDYSVFDPNDSNLTKVNAKIRCISSINPSMDTDWYAGSNQGLILKDGDYGKWSNLTDCEDYIFSNPFLNYSDPCSVTRDNFYCNLMEKTFPIN